MEIQNVAELANKQFQNKKSEDTQTVSFKESILNNHEQNSHNKESLTFENINNISVNEMEENYQDKQQVELFKILKLATLFSGNVNMNKAMFNSVLDQDGLEKSQEYMYSMMSNRNSYLSNSNDNGAWLRSSLISELEGDAKREQIQLEKEFLNTMLQFDVAQHMNDMMDFSKSGRDRNKNNNDLSLMYNNTYLKYQNLFNEFEKIENNSAGLLNQYLTTSKMNFLNL